MRTFATGTRNRSASSARTRNGCWQLAQTVISSPYLGDHRVRFHRVLVDGGKRVLALHDDVGVREDSLGLAPVEPVPVADDALAGSELAEAMEEARHGFALGHERGARRYGRLDVRDDWQLLVFDHDRLHAGRRGAGSLGSDRGDLLAVKPDLVDREDRAILDRMPVV